MSTSIEEKVTETDVAVKQETELKCYVCSEVFIYSTHLREHMKSEHNKDEAFQCPICSKTFKQLSAVNFHVKQMHSENNKQKFICPECSESFSTSVNFRIHMKSEHNQENNFPCPNCSKSFKEARHVNLHVRKVHNNERPFSCNFCSKSFQVAGNLERHVKGTHLKEKNFLCQECPQRFSQKATLLIHVGGVHAKEKPFQCPQCSLRYLSSQKMTEHIQYAHEGVRNFLCHLCPGKFANKQNLGNHVKNVHSVARQLKKSAGPKPRGPRKRKRVDKLENEIMPHQHVDLKDNSTEVDMQHYRKPEQVVFTNPSSHYFPNRDQEQQQCHYPMPGPARPPTPVVSTPVVCMVDVKEENFDSSESINSDDNLPDEGSDSPSYLVESVEDQTILEELSVTDIAINQLDAGLRYRIYHAFKDLTKSEILSLIGKQVLNRSELVTIVLAADRCDLKTCEFIDAIIQTFQNE